MIQGYFFTFYALLQVKGKIYWYVLVLTKPFILGILITEFRMTQLLFRSSRNTALNFLNILISLVCGVFLSVIIARQLGPTNLGVYSFLTFMVSLAVTVFSFGLPSTANKYVAEYTGRNDIRSVNGVLRLLTKIGLISGVIGTLILFIALGVGSAHLGKSIPTYYIILAAAAIAPTILGSMIKGVATGFQDFYLLLKVNVISTLAAVFLTLIVLWLKFDVAGLLAINIVIALVALLYLFFRFFPRDRHPFTFPSLPTRQVFEIFHFVWPVAVISILDLIVWQYSEVIFLGFSRPSSETAYYTIPFNIALMIMTTFPGAFIGILLPTMSAMFGEDSTARLTNIFQASYKYILYLILPICAGLTVLSGPLIRLFYGAEFARSATVLPFLLLSSGLGQLAAVGSSLLYSMKKQKVILKFMVAVTVINLGLDWLLIPKYGLTGAVAANIISQTVSSAFTLLIAFRVVKTRIASGVFFKPLLASATAALLVWAVIRGAHPATALLIGIPVQIIIYSVIMARLGTLNASDRDILVTLSSRLPSPIKSIVARSINMVRYV